MCVSGIQAGSPEGGKIQGMNLPAIRVRRIRIAILLLVSLMLAPGAAADDYFFLFPPGQGEGASGSAFLQGAVISGENGTAEDHSCHACSCLVCEMTVQNAGTPSLPLSVAGNSRPASSAWVKIPVYLEIFHPPNA